MWTLTIHRYTTWNMMAHGDRVVTVTAEVATDCMAKCCLIQRTLKLKFFISIKQIYITIFLGSIWNIPYISLSFVSE